MFPLGSCLIHRRTLFISSSLAFVSSPTVHRSYHWQTFLLVDFAFHVHISLWPSAVRAKKSRFAARTRTFALRIASVLPFYRRRIVDVSGVRVGDVSTSGCNRMQNPVEGITRYPFSDFRRMLHPRRERRSSIDLRLEFDDAASCF